MNGNMNREDDEMWQPIAGYEGVYAVSNQGRVMRVARGSHTHVGLILKPRINSRGYLQISLHKDGKRGYPRIHQLVAKAFLPQPTPEQTNINHIDGDKINNCDSNLEWCTPAENTRHAVQLGLRAAMKGEAQGGSKLTEADILEIRARYKPGQRPYMSELAQEYGVSKSHIGHIISRRFWKHI